MVMQTAPSPYRRILVGRLLGFVGYGYRSSSDRLLPLPYGQRRGVVSRSTGSRGDSSAGASRRPSGLREQREQGSRGLRVRPSAEHRAGTPSGSRLDQAASFQKGQDACAGDLCTTIGTGKCVGSASIDEEHHTVMSAVVQKVQSAKSGLTEACASLLTGFEVSV